MDRRWRELAIESEDPEAGTFTIVESVGTEEHPVPVVFQTAYPFVPGSVRAFVRDDDILPRELIGG